MTAEIITIGDEILIGQIVDTNSAWIAAELNQAGVRIGRKYSVGDSHSEIASALGESLSRCNVVITTGGLGPTKDDITKSVFAELFACPMVRHQPTYDLVRRLCQNRALEFNELNQSQADIPSCAQVITNHHGTAPGLWIEQQSRVVIALPGVPFEMKELMVQVVERLKERFQLGEILHKTAVIYGIGESVLAKKIEVWEDALPQWLHLAYLPNPAGIRLRLSTYDQNMATAQAEIERQFNALKPYVGNALIGFDLTTIYSALAKMLTDRGMTLAIAESCTGGYLSSRLTQMSGASAYLLGSVVSYSNSVKSGVLGVNEGDIERQGAVSEIVARQMAQGVRDLCRADCSISLTGIAGPDGGSELKPVGTVWIAVTTPRGTRAKMFNFGDLRDINIERSASRAADMLRCELLLLGED